MLRNRRSRASAALAAATLAATLAAADQALVRIERGGERDRNALLAAGAPLVAEMSGCFLAVGDGGDCERAAAAVGLEAVTLDLAPAGARYAVAGLRPGPAEAALGACGEVVWREANWVILRLADHEAPECWASPQLMLRLLPGRPLSPSQPPPERFVSPEDGDRRQLEPDPLVQEMVSGLTEAEVVATWDALIGSASTRYSQSAGCGTAAAWVADRFSSHGLAAEQVAWSPGHAPNVVGTLPGLVSPQEVVIALGHLDDLPSFGLAPGADDNASGAALVTVLARVMSGYGFASTVRFVAVTGEESGLLGSTAYAEAAFQAGEQIAAVLNADMVGWEGDGHPAVENLDVSFDAASQWLGELMAEAAAAYGTGCSVDAFLCPDLTASDHAPFWDRGWSAVCGITDGEGYCGHGGHYPYYHQSSDTVANCGDPGFYAGVVKTYLATLAHIAGPVCRRPQAPAAVQAQGAGENQVSLSWDPAPGGAAYEVLRAPGGCADPAPYYLVGTTQGTSFVDGSASGGLTYAYRVRAVDATGVCRSLPSPCTEAGTTGDCLEPPGFAGVAAVTDQHTSSCGLAVSWPVADRLYCGSSVRFNVYRSAEPDVEPAVSTLVASCLTASPWVDVEVEPGVTYHYVVRAEDDTSGHGGPCGGNEDRNLLTRSGTASGPLVPLVDDDVEGATSGWSAAAGPGDGGGTSPWTVAATASHSPTHAWFCDDESRVKDQVLVTASGVDLPADRPSVLRFWHRFATESVYDGGVLEYSADGGSSWHDILAGDGGAVPDDPARLVLGGYTRQLRSGFQNPLGGRAAWSGDSGGWVRVEVDLSDLAGRTVLLRWRLGCDVYVGGDGWWVDDVRVEYATDCAPSDVIYADGFESGDTARWSSVSPSR